MISQSGFPGDHVRPLGPANERGTSENIGIMFGRTLGVSDGKGAAAALRAKPARAVLDAWHTTVDGLHLTTLDPADIGSHLLTVDGTGHTSVHAGKSCAQAVTSAYLLKLVLPKQGASCRVTDAPFG